MKANRFSKRCPTRSVALRRSALVVAAALSSILSLLSTPFAVLSAADLQQAWLVRYNGSGAVGTNQAVAAALDSQGSLVVCGSSTGVSGDFDYIVLKYSAGGTPLWTSRFESPGGADDQARAMKLDEDDNVYVTGTSVTVKYDSSGQEQWTAPYGGRDLAPDTNGNVYVVGFDENDFATVKLDSTGSNVWVRTYDGSGQKDVAQTVVVGNGGNIYVAGVERYRISSFVYDKFAILAYNSMGGQLWVTNHCHPTGKWKKMVELT